MKKSLLWPLLLLISINSLAQEEHVSLFKLSDIDFLRSSIKQYIWKDQTDTSSITEVKNDTALKDQIAAYVEEYSNLKNVDRLTVQMKNNFTSNCIIFHPKVYNHLGVGLIYHGGHDGFLWEDRYLNNSGRPNSISVINFFLGKGFDVICIDMPLCGFNSGGRVVEENNQERYVFSHDDIFELADPFYYFFEPVKSCIDFLEKKKRYERFAMLGLSGGGWTTTIYSAIDPRISQSFEVAGSIPIPYRINFNDIGDKEQNVDDFYNSFNYSTLYALAATGPGKLHFQILNQGDNCCFDFDGNKAWVPEVQEKLASLKAPGKYDFYYDPFATMHKISAVAMDTIYTCLKAGILQEQLPPASVKYDSSATIFCNGESLRLSVPSLRGDTIEWYRSGDPLPFATTRRVKITESGTYLAKVINISGVYRYSDSVTAEAISLPQPWIAKRNDTLYSSSDAYNQWYREGVAIPNATDSWFRPSSPGSYSVRLHFKDCSSAASEVYDYGLLIYPNPSTGNFNIVLDPSFGKMDLRISDASGRIILIDRFAGKKRIEGIKPGIYFLRLSGNTTSMTRTLVIH